MPNRTNKENLPVDISQPLSYEFDYSGVDRSNLKKALARAKGRLLPQEEYVINARFGLTTNGVEQKPPQIARSMGISTNRVNSLLLSAKKKLRLDSRLKDFHNESIFETATAGSTSSGNIATVLPASKIMIKRGKFGAPVAAQHKNADGTAKSALNVNTSIFGGTPVKRKKTNEALEDFARATDMDHEVQMARADLYRIAEYAIKLHNILKNVSESEGIEGWVQSKITLAADYIDSVFHHMEYQEMESQMDSPVRMPAAEGVDPYKDRLRAKLEEKSVSKVQQQAAGIALAAKRKGEKPAGKGAAAQMAKMSTKELEKFAKTKHKGLPKKKR